MGGKVRIGPPIKSNTSAITDIPRAESARHRKSSFPRLINYMKGRYKRYFY